VTTGCSNRVIIWLFRSPAREILLPVYIEEMDKTFTIAWLGTYRIEGQAFLYSEQNSGRIRIVLGYPIRHIIEQIGS
jgi:hypothetical protein